jgi:hypothetical protein
MKEPVKKYARSLATFLKGINQTFSIIQEKGIGLIDPIQILNWP